MRAYLVCILDSDNYREPTFLFFKNIFENAIDIQVY